MDISENFERFFDWGLGLKNPQDQIPEIGRNLGFGVRRHPIGFTVVYLSPPNRGIHTMGLWGAVRADIFPAGVDFQDDIHSHGFDFFSGIIDGELSNTRHYPDWGQADDEGLGYVGYESSVDFAGNNITTQVTDATVVIPHSESEEMAVGDSYTMKPRVDFHSVSAVGGAVTIFCKTPTYEGQDGLALVLKKPDASAPPTQY